VPGARAEESTTRFYPTAQGAEELTGLRFAAGQPLKEKKEERHGCPFSSRVVVVLAQRPNGT